MATGILVVVAMVNSAGPGTAFVLITRFAAAVPFGSMSRSPSAMFLALLGIAFLDVAALTLTPVL